MRPWGLKVHTAVTIVFPRTAQAAFELRRVFLVFGCFFAAAFRRVRNDLQGREPPSLLESKQVAHQLVKRFRFSDNYIYYMFTLGRKPFHRHLDDEKRETESASDRKTFSPMVWLRRELFHSRLHRKEMGTLPALGPGTVSPKA